MATPTPYLAGIMDQDRNKRHTSGEAKPRDGVPDPDKPGNGTTNEADQSTQVVLDVGLDDFHPPPPRPLTHPRHGNMASLNHSRITGKLTQTYDSGVIVTITTLREYADPFHMYSKSTSQSQSNNADGATRAQDSQCHDLETAKIPDRAMVQEIERIAQQAREALRFLGLEFGDSLDSPIIDMHKEEFTRFARPAQDAVNEPAMQINERDLAESDDEDAVSDDEGHVDALERDPFWWD